MNQYGISEEQLKQLKNTAVALRADPPPSQEDLASMGYSIESLIAEVETMPLNLDDETIYGEQSDDDDDESSGSGGSEREL